MQVLIIRFLPVGFVADKSMSSPVKYSKYQMGLKHKAYGGHT